MQLARLLDSQEVEVVVVADSVARQDRVCPDPVTRQGSKCRLMVLLT